MNTSLTIEHTDDGAAGAFFVSGEDGVSRIAELTYVRRGEVLVAEHTNVDPSLRGQGVARRLVDALVAYARANALRIQPVCSYVLRVMDGDADGLSDVRA